MTVVAEEDWITAVMPAPPGRQKTVGSQPLQDQLHFATGSGLQAGAHHLHAVQEQRETAQKTQKPETDIGIPPSINTASAERSETKGMEKA